jgi:hypothetical protein
MISETPSYSLFVRSSRVITCHNPEGTPLSNGAQFAFGGCTISQIDDTLLGDSWAFPNAKIQYEQRKRNSTTPVKVIKEDAIIILDDRSHQAGKF